MPLLPSGVAVGAHQGLAELIEWICFLAKLAVALTIAAAAWHWLNKLQGLPLV